MPAIVILGAQWGDEGKGKATDLLATTDTIDFVVRTSGGHNAGHTIVVNGEKFATHLLPERHPHPGCDLGDRQRRRRLSRGAVPRARLADRARRRAGRPGGQRQRARDRAVPLDGRQGDRAVPRQEPDRHHRPRHRAGVLRQGQPARHPRRRPVRRVASCGRRSRARSTSRTTSWPRSTTGARSRRTRSSRSCCRTPTGCGRWSPTRRCC